MKKHRLLKRTLLLTMVLCLLATCALGEGNREPYRFMDIPYENMNEEKALEMLREHVTEGEYRSILDFYGYPMYVSVDSPGGKRINRILLSDAGEAWSDAENYRDYTARDVEIFVGLDKHLTELYGEPDLRFFVSGDNKYQDKLPKNWRFMFGDGQWTEERLMEVFDTDDHLFRAYSVWNNVILELWVRGNWETQFGYCNELHVAYYPTEQKFNQKTVMLDWPPEI